jgi:hypothetical protein
MAIAPGGCSGYAPAAEQDRAEPDMAVPAMSGARPQTCPALASL